MKEETKFKIRAYLSYIFMAPLVSKFYIFNLSYISWFLIFLSLLFTSKIIRIVLVILAVILYLIKEYKDGNYIYWYRNKKYPEYKEALNKVRAEKKQLNLNTPIELINGGIGDGTENKENY